MVDPREIEQIQAATVTAVFVRVTPEQKLRLVEALQAHGEVAAMTAAALAFTYVPLMNRMFHIALMDWAHILAVGLVIYLVIGVEKAFRRHWEKGDSET